MDVKNAFLHGDLEETVYMKFPPGYERAGFRFSLTNSHTPTAHPHSMVCKLTKSLYGLDQAPRQWFAKLSSVLKINGFTQSKSDYSLFTREEDGSFVAILAYVDDLILTGNNMAKITQAKAFLSKEFKMKDLGELRYFL